jgi:hypothetical protein
MQSSMSVVLLSGILVTACGSSTAAPPSVVSPGPAVPRLEVLSVTAQETTYGYMLQTNTNQLTATATFSDGASQIVTDQATWSTSNAGIATVSGTGLVRVRGWGTVAISAKYQSATSSITLDMRDCGCDCAGC